MRAYKVVTTSLLLIKKFSKEIKKMTALISNSWIQSYFLFYAAFQASRDELNQPFNVTVQSNWQLLPNLVMTRGRFLSNTVSVRHDLDAIRIQIPWLPARVNSWCASTLQQSSLCDMAIHQSRNKGKPRAGIISGQRLQTLLLVAAQLGHRYLFVTTSCRAFSLIVTSLIKNETFNIICFFLTPQRETVGT